MKQLEKALEQLNIFCDEAKLKQYERYMDGVLRWNEKVNLTAITDREDFIKKHFVDSLLSVPCPEFQRSQKIIDVGTGAGFPGIPLALAAPDKQFVLMDSLNKRIKIIRELCEDIGIDNVTVIHGRAEELGRSREHRENYDLCVSRAVANLATLSEYCLPFIKKGGWFLAYKGPGLEAEVKEAQKAISLLGGKIQRQETASLPDFDLEHKIIYIQKEKLTPKKYPRKSGTPSKEPLK